MGKPEEQATEQIHESLKEDLLLRGFKDVVQSWSVTRTMQIAIIATVMSVGLSISYYLVIFAPKQAQTKAEIQTRQMEAAKEAADYNAKLETARVALEIAKEQQKQQTQLENEVLLQDCLTTAHKNYNRNWALANETEALKPSNALRSAAISCVVRNGRNNEVCLSLARYAEAARRNASADYEPAAPLPVHVANDLTADYYRAKDLCVRMYPR